MVVVSYESAGVLDACLGSLERAAPVHGVEIRVVDNGSADPSAAIAERRVGAARVVRRARNDGFAAGVNAGLDALAPLGVPCYAVLNPDTITPPGALDRLADVLGSDDRAALVGPRVLSPDGVPESTVGRFPTLDRERAHTWWLDQLLGREGRRAPFPRHTAEVDWVSGCAWMLCAIARRETGPLDEGYFMYWEDVDYCRRLRDRGWKVLATPDVTIEHGLGRGSQRTGTVPADGGIALLRYFAKFAPDVPEETVLALLQRGWSIRRTWRALRAAFGDRASAAAVRRYTLAIDAAQRHRGGMAGVSASSPAQGD